MKRILDALCRWEVTLEGRTFRFFSEREARWAVSVARCITLTKDGIPVDAPLLHPVGRDRWTGRTWR